MRPTIAKGVTMITLLLAGTGLAKGAADFREADWGMSLKQVKMTELSSQLSGEMPGLLIYEGEITGVNASIFYFFEEDKLVRGLYSIETLPQDKIIESYEEIRIYMLEEYGEPDETGMGPEDESYTGDLDPANPEDIYDLVLRKSISPETIWKRGTTRIYLRLIEKDGRVAVMIDYIIFPAEK